jgi:hypothetical protein
MYRDDDDEDWPDSYRDLGDNDGYIRIPLRNSGIEPFEDFDDEELDAWLELKLRMFYLYARVREIKRQSAYRAQRDKWRYSRFYRRYWH